MKKTRRFGDYVYDLRKVCKNKLEARQLVRAVKSSGKRARIVQSSEGYGVYVK